MYTTMMACSYSFHPATSTPAGIARTYRAVFFVALGAILGWPFSAALGLPLVLEHMFLTGGDVAVGKERTTLRKKRWETMLKAIAIGASIAVSFLGEMAVQALIPNRSQYQLSIPGYTGGRPFRRSTSCFTTYSPRRAVQSYTVLPHQLTTLPTSFSTSTSSSHLLSSRFLHYFSQTSSITGDSERPSKHPKRAKRARTRFLS